MEEDPEKIQWQADECIAVVKIHNDKRWLEKEDQKQKEDEEEQRMKEEEEEWEQKEEEDQKKEEADKDTYEKKLVKACKKQLQVSWEVSVTSGG